MKSKNLLLLLVFSFFVSGAIDAQSPAKRKKITSSVMSVKTIEPISEDTVNFASTIQPNHSRDTLYLTKGDTLSKLTESIWKMDKRWKGSMPTLVYVSPERMRIIKSNYMVVMNARITPKKPDDQ